MIFLQELKLIKTYNKEKKFILYHRLLYLYFLYLYYTFIFRLKIILTLGTTSLTKFLILII